MDFVIIAILAILGAGLIVGGIVLFRGSSTVLPRTIGASTAAMGLVMWLLIMLIIPARQEGSAPEPVIVQQVQVLTEESSINLLTVDDVVK